LYLTSDVMFKHPYSLPDCACWIWWRPGSGRGFSSALYSIFFVRTWSEKYICLLKRVVITLRNYVQIILRTWNCVRVSTSLLLTYYEACSQVFGWRGAVIHNGLGWGLFWFVLFANFWSLKCYTMGAGCVKLGRDVHS
jgi:hypothetical protein